LLLITTAGMLAAALASPAAAATTVTYAGAGSGWNDIFDPTGSGTPSIQAANYRFTLAGTEVRTYCADRALALNSGASFTVAPATAGWAARATHLAAHHAEIGTPVADANDEAAATQIAIWTLTNGDAITAGTVPDAGIRARATELAAATTTQAVPGAVDPSLELSIGGTAGSATATATLAGLDDLAGHSVSFQTSAGTLTATTDGAGVASVALGAAAGTVTASVSATIGAGVLLVPADGSQPQITADPFTATATATAEIPAPVPTTTVAPAPTNQLPYTGSSTSPWLWVTGAALLGLAGVAVSRRRS
jgi:LPXTG-motif cell wall-anchored protein